jgi:threonylcarbamoyladenosine tRNA methylthiotransferase MtaB
LNGSTVRYSVITFGCRVNQADSLGIEEALRSRGAASAVSAEADLIVVNTCSVTSSADQGARQTVRRIARENPTARIVVTGCYATRAADEVAALPNVVRVVRNDDKRRLTDIVADACGLSTADRFGDGDGACGASIEPGVAGRTAFTLRVQTGCEERCSYCVIPSTRGPGRSLPLREAVKEVRRAAAAGFREIVLTGVHLGSYGRDLQPVGSLAELLRALSDLDEDVVFRISSLEPMDCTREIVEMVAQSGGRFAPHFHLPLQHASDRVLVRMQRPYTLAYYRSLVDEIARRIPHVSVGSDVIVGFPGESDEDFEELAAYLADSPLSHIHVFPYSDRPGTVAAQLPAHVPGAVIRQRAARLRATGAALTRRFREAQIGHARPGLTLEDGTLVVTDNFLKVRIPPGQARNERVIVLLQDKEVQEVQEVQRVQGVPVVRGTF